MKIISPRRHYDSQRIHCIPYGTVFTGNLAGPIFMTPVTGTFIRLATHVACLETGGIFDAGAASGVYAENYVEHPNATLTLEPK